MSHHDDASLTSTMVREERVKGLPGDALLRRSTDEAEAFKH